MPFSQVNGYIPGTPWCRPRAPAIRLQEVMQTLAHPPVSGCPGLSVRGTPPRPPAPRAWLGDESLLWSHCTQLLWNTSAHFQYRAGAQVSVMCPKLQRLGNHSMGVRRVSSSRPHQAWPSGPLCLRFWPQPRAVETNGWIP